MFVEQPRIRDGDRLQGERGRNPRQSRRQLDAVVHRSFLMQGWEDVFDERNTHVIAPGRARELMCQQRDIGSQME
jgi:hypothetical protein